MCTMSQCKPYPEHVSCSILKSRDSGEDQHEDRGQQEQRVETHQNLRKVLKITVEVSQVTMAGLDESASSNRSQILRRIVEQQIPSKVSVCKC